MYSITSARTMKNVAFAYATKLLVIIAKNFCAPPKKNEEENYTI